MRPPALATALVATLALTGPLSAAENLKELSFGIISTESSQNLAKDFEPIRADLETSVGMPVKLFFAPDYSGVIEAMRFDKVQLGWFGNKSALDAVDRAQGEVFCQVVDKDGANGYYSLIVVHQDSPLNALEDLLAKGKELTFSNGDPQSTSGYLVPGYYAFAMHHFDPSKDFKVCRNGNHESNAMAVANKQVDAATFNTEAMFKLEHAHPESAKQLKAIWKGPLIASDPLVYRQDLAAPLKQKINAFFLAYGSSPEQRSKIAPLKWSGFKASSNDQLLPFRQLSLLKEKSKVEADANLVPADKAAKVAELDKRLSDISAQLMKAEKAMAAK